MAAGQDVFEEHLGVIAALKDNYTRQDDAAMVAHTTALRDELAQLCAGREEEVKQAIRELSQHVATVGAQAAYPNPEGSHEARVSELEGANAEAQAVTVALTGELRELEQQREKLKERFAELHHRSEDVDRMVTEAEPQTRHNLSLYAHVSKITWKFDGADLVAGDVSIPATGDIRPFEYDPQVMSQFDIINHLWDAMDGR